MRIVCCERAAASDGPLHLILRLANGDPIYLGFAAHSSLLNLHACCLHRAQGENNWYRDHCLRFATIFEYNDVSTAFC